MPQHSFRNAHGPKRKIVVSSSLISPAGVLGLSPRAARSVNMLRAALAPAGFSLSHSPGDGESPSALASTDELIL